MNQPNPELLKQLVQVKMPFGKYQGRLIADLPEPYLIWFRKKGYPKGKLGVLMETCYEIKSNGLEEILYELKSLFSEKTDKK
ncbi:MAG: DUF3820 family protein [Saprospiraceae bacterium]|nr:DUF3820 family protein [Saprospiraceae bacterium]